MESDIEKTYRDARKQSGLSHSEKDASYQQAVVVLHDAHQGHDDAPRNHDGRQPHARMELLQQQVTRDLERGVCEEEDCEAPVVLIGSHS